VKEVGEVEEVMDVKEVMEVKDVEELRIILITSFVGRGFNRDICKAAILGLSP
jgi:hypothetical protein